MVVPIAKPKTGQMQGAKIGSAGDTLRIKIKRCVSRYRTKLEDSTGDGDTAPTNNDNGYRYGAVTLNGWVVGGQTIGIAQVGSDTALAVELIYSTGQKAAGSIKVSDITVDWIKDATKIPIAIAGLFEGTITETYTAP